MIAPARVLLRLSLGAVAALLVWLAFGADAWGGAVVATCEKVIRAVERPRATRLELVRSEVEIHRSDMGTDSDTPAFDVAAFTAPTVVLLTLLWGCGRLVPRHGAWRGLAALALLFAAQVFHLLLAVEVFYATELGEWSTAFYPRWQRETLAAGRSAFDLVLAWGLPFALWIAFHGLPAFRSAEPAPRRPRRKK